MKEEFQEEERKIALVLKILISLIIVSLSLVAVIYPAFGNFVICCLAVHLIRIFLEI